MIAAGDYLCHWGTRDTLLPSREVPHDRVRHHSSLCQLVMCFYMVAALCF